MAGVYGNPFSGGAVLPEYDYGGIGSVATSTLGLFIGMLIFFYIVILALGIVSYIFQSIGLYSVAKRRGIAHAWLAWIPVGVLWIFGSISDQYQYVAKGRVRNRRKTLLGLSIGILAASLGIGICYGVMIAGGIMGMSGAIGGGILAVALLSLVSSVLSIITLVYNYIAMYDVYVSCNPETATVFLVLSIFFSILYPFFIFAVRKKDLGMPPRRTEPVVEAVLAEPAVEDIPTEDVPAEEMPTETPEEEM